MAAFLTLADLKPGDNAKIIGFHAGNRDYRRHLLDMGLTPNTEIQIIRHAPLGDPVQIQVRNYLLSLRKAEAGLLKLERVK